MADREKSKLNSDSSAQSNSSQKDSVQNRKVLLDLISDNEVRSNWIASKCLLGITLLFGILGLAALFGLYDVGDRVIAIDFVIVSLLGVFIYIHARLLQFKHRGLKYLVLIGILLVTSVTHFLFPQNAIAIFYLPLLVSTCYYDRKLSAIVYILSWLLYTANMALNVILEQTSSVVAQYHAYMEVTIWKHPKFVLLYYFIPQTAMFLITAAIGAGLSLRGKNLIQAQADMYAKAVAAETEIATAKKIQRGSLPATYYKDPDGRYEVSAFLRPVKEIGGDFYGYFRMGDDVVFMIGDVSDKGLPAAMFMMQSKNTIKTLVQNSSSLQEAITRANTALLDDNKSGMFVTLWIGILNVKTGVGQYVNCGHLPPLLKHADGTVEAIECEPDLFLGILEDVAPEAHVFRLDAGDQLLLFTDGLTDAENEAKKQFGSAALRGALADSKANTAQLCENLIERIDVFAGKSTQFDDMTALAISFNEIEPSHRASLEVPAVSASIEQIMNGCNDLLQSVACPQKARRLVDVMMDEVCANIVGYAYKGTPEDGTMRVELEAGANFFKAEFIDHGVAFDPLDGERPVTDAVAIATSEDDQLDSLDDISEGGLGIYFIRSLSDDCQYRYENHENHFTVTKIW